MVGISMNPSYQGAGSSDHDYYPVVACISTCTNKAGIYGLLRRVSVGQANKSCQSLHKDLPGYKHNFEAGPSTVTPYPQPTMRGLLMANQKLEVFTLLARLATPESQPSCRANVYDALQKKMQQLQPRDRCMPTINHQNGKASLWSHVLRGAVRWQMANRRKQLQYPCGGLIDSWDRFVV